MKQSRLMSLIESVTNVTVGFVLAIGTQYAVFPLFGLHANFMEHISIGAAFVFVSMVRSYVLRRFFEWMHWREE